MARHGMGGIGGCDHEERGREQITAGGGLLLYILLYGIADDGLPRQDRIGWLRYATWEEGGCMRRSTWRSEGRP